MHAQNQTHTQTAQQTALARTLFQEGVKLADRGDWVNAADRFGRAYSVKATPGIAFNWARALAETDKVLQAHELLMQVSRDENADPQLRRESEALLTELEPRIPRLRVTTDREPDESTEITVDQAPWPRAAWGVGSPVDPGPHTVVCAHDGRELARSEFTLRQGEVRDVRCTLPRLAEGPSASLVSTNSDLPRKDEPKKPLLKNWMLWTAVGAVVVGGTVLAVVLARPDEAKEASPVMGNANPGVVRW